MNPVRGEAALVLGGVERMVRATFERLVCAEAEVGPLFALIERAVEGKLSLGEAAALLWHCLEGERPERGQFGELLIDTGLAAAMPAVRAVLVQVLKGR